MTSIDEYTSRLKIPITGDPEMLFTDAYKRSIAYGYERIVIGKRGPYIEFHPTQIKHSHFVIPNDQAWRIHSDKAYYIEYRSTESNIKLYYQLKSVDYADYKFGRCYISPFDLYVSGFVVIEKKK